MKPIRPLSTIATRVRNGVLPHRWASATVPATPDAPLVTPLPPMRELLGPVNIVDLHDDGGGRVEAPPDEEGMPRWLRPSLRAARGGPGPVTRWDD